MIFNTSYVLSQKQQNIKINFEPKFENYFLQKDSIYLINQDSFQISQCKFYISSIELKNGNRTVYKEKNSFHLIDIFDKASSQIFIKPNTVLSFDAIQFNLGIDSITNAKGISTGALDPLKGMYWAWHSGYINLKLEGKSNLCKTKNNNFQFHLGGFRQGFYNMQTIVLKAKKSSVIKIDFDLIKFLSVIDLQKENHVMMPSRHAVDLSKKAASMFNISN
jgi:hypothetical protein